MKNAWGDEVEDSTAVNAWGDPIQVEAAQPEQPGFRLPSAISGPLKFAGNVAQSLSTGPINAVAQAVQDADQGNSFGSMARSIPGTVAQAAKNVVKSTLNPFVPGPNPIQSSETTFERAGVPNKPMPPPMRYPGEVFPGGNAPMAGLASQAGTAVDILTPAFVPSAVGKLGKAVGADKALSAAGAPVRSAAGGLAKKFESGANRIQQTVLKPRAGDWNSGAKIENIPKYGIQGGVDDVIKGSDLKIKEASTKLREAIQSGADDGATVDIDAILDATKAKIAKEGNPDLVSSMEPIFAEFRQWAKVSGERSGQAGGKANLLEAQQFKQMMGSHGAWEKTAAAKNMKLSQGETFQSKAAQEVYQQLKNAIEDAAPEGVKELNRTLSELIPIRNAAVYRKIVSDRNNPIGLTDMLSAMTAVGNGPAGVAMLAASKFTTKGFGAKAMYGISKSLKGLSESKSAAEAKFYLAKLEKENLNKAEIADALTEMRRPLDMNQKTPRPQVWAGARRPLEKEFGPKQATAKKAFDPLDLLAEQPAKPGAGVPGFEGMGPSEMEAARAAARKAENEAFIRKYRSKGVQ